MKENSNLIRRPAVAGSFYPANAKILKDKIEKYLAAATSSPDSAARMLIVPHAGYDFSGSVAAYAYQAIARRKIKTVVIIGSSHTSYFAGAAIDGYNIWRTPLGDVEVDKRMGEKLVKADKNIKFNSAVHDDDHMIEVQLPFLQTVLAPGFKIMPIALGNMPDESYKDLADALAPFLSSDDLLVISSDMSHYPAYGDANRIDKETLELIQSQDVGRLDDYVSRTMAAGVPNEQTLLCGLEAVKAGIELANKLNWQAEIMHYANSGDSSSGDKDSVVGYGAVIFSTKNYELRINNFEEKDALNENQKKELLKIAKTSVETYVKTGEVADFKISDERLKRPEGIFVTLNKKGELRGCIGLIISTGTPLWENVREMAIAAATEDNRFLPVAENELPELDYEISVLSEPRRINNWQEIKLGEQGVIVTRGSAKGVFLPQVATETGWDREEFLSQLCSQKAGLPPDCYKNDPQVKLEVFTAEVFSE